MSKTRKDSASQSPPCGQCNCEKQWFAIRCIEIQWSEDCHDFQLFAHEKTVCGPYEQRFEGVAAPVSTMDACKADVYTVYVERTESECRIE